MSVLKDALQAEKQQPQSKFEQWITTLDDDDRAALMADALGHELPNAALIRACDAAGYKVSKDTVAVWRSEVRAHGNTR